MVCPFCGVETGASIAHETQVACVEALRAQVSELRNVLQHARRPDESPNLPEGAAAAGVKKGDAPQ